ncbi:MAG TPA: FtsX-like permease family protein [Blastocatellia bacterium]|nr:FtsX-like permease family protein [Blastocatellia bacterium]
MIKHICKLVWNRKRINFLITLEIFFSFLVVFAVIVFAVYYADNYRHPLGFDYQNVWYVGVGIEQKSDNSDNAQNLVMARQILATLREFNEVESVAGVWGAPYSRGNWTSGYDDKKTGRPIRYNGNTVTDDLREVVKLNLVRGRWFGKEDDGASYKSVVINQQLAREMFGNEDPLGKSINDPDEKPRDGKPRKEERVVGVVDDFRKNGEFSELKGNVFFRNTLSHEDDRPPRSFVLKVHPGTTAAFEEKLIARLHAIARDWSFDIKRLEEMRAANHKEYYVPMLAFALVAGFLMIMVGLGLTGVLWQSVTQRTKEIGLRRAKGATSRRIYKQILAELLVITTFGLIAGTLIVVQFPLLNVLGFASGRVYVYSLLLSLALVYVLTIICGLYPSRLATKVQPAEALHYE